MINASYGGQLTSITASLGDNQAGAYVIYTFTFTTSGIGNGANIGIPADGKIVITFPSGFDVSEAEIASATDPNILDGGLTASGTGGIITVLRDATGTPVAGNTTVGIKVGIIQNASIAATNYSVNIETQIQNGTVIDSGTSSTFSITHNKLSFFQFNSITSQAAGSFFSVTITAKDQYDNTVISFTNIASLTDLTGTVSPTTTTNFINGVWNGNIQITKAHSNNKIMVTAQDKSGTSNEFTVYPNILDHFNFQTISSPQIAGALFSITITAKDAYSNTVTTFNGTATLSDNTGSIAPTSTTAFSSGQWTGDVSITKKQKDVRIAVSASGITNYSNYFNVQAANVDHFVITNISSQTAGTPFLIEVFAMDQFNNQVDQFEETINISDLTGTITPTISDDFSLGYWAGNVSVTQVQANNIITVERTSTGIETGTSNGFNITHNSLDHFVFASIPTTQTAGNAFSITITAKDAYENTVTNFGGTASLSDLTGTISPGITGNFTSGSWTSNVTITKSQTANRILVTGGNKTGTSNSFNVNPYILDHFRFQTIASPQVAGQSFSITITAEDIYNNRVTNFTNAVTLDDDTDTIFPKSTGNFSSGQWTGNVQITKSQNDVKITAIRQTVTGNSNTFNVEPGSLDHFTLATIGTQAAGVPFTITVTAQDFHNNRVTDFDGTVLIQDLTGTISPPNSGAFDLGQWSGDVTITNVITNDRITVTNSGGSQIGTSNNFDVVAGNIDHFDISNISSPKTAGVPFSVMITAKDANNAVVNNFTGTANLSDLTGSLSPIATTNFVNGQWTGNLTITKSYSNNQITVTGAGKSGNSNQFNIQANSVNHFSFNTITSPKTAGQSYSITIYARDSYENIVTSFSNSVNLTDNTSTINPPSTTNFSNGQWTGNVTITKAQNDIEITASQGGVNGKSNKFNVQSASLHHFSLNNISTQQSNQPFPITVTARDQYENAATQFTGKVNISDQTNTISPTESDSFNNGRWTGNVVISQAYESNVIQVANQSGSEQGSSNSFDVISSTVDHFVIALIGDQVAGQSFSITIRAEDAANNIVTTFTGTASLSDLTGTISPKITASFINGQWTGSVTITSSRAANKITVTSGGRAGTSNLFDVDPASLNHFRVSPVGSPQIAGQSFSITITAEDNYNNKITGFTGVVNLSDNSGSLSPTISQNFVSGEWTGNVTITKSIIDNIINISGSGKSGQSNKFNVIAAGLHHFVIGTITTQAAGKPFPITVTAQDNYGNTATQFTGQVDISDNTGTLSPTESANFINGQWTGNVVISQAYENNVITVIRQGGSESGSSNSFDIISSNVDHFVISSIGTQVAGQPFSITIRAEDSNNNLVTNFTGTASLTDLTGTISPQTTSSFSGGQWNGSVTITKSRTGNTITIASGGKAGVSNSFNINPAELNHFKIANIGSPQVAGQSFSITVTAEDIYNNKVTGFTGAVNFSDNTGTINPQNSGNFSSGEWTGLVTITRTSTDNKINISGSGKTGQSNGFNVIAAGLHHFIVATITTQAAGGPFPITITAEDNYGNTATQFTGKVNISDKSGTISPLESGNFSSGKWTGNVIISRTYSNNVITVINQGGSQSGSSNNFDVISSAVDHFVVSTIGNQMAGQAFSITIRAEDSNNNLVTNFSGTASLTDLTGTITPSTTGNFSGGQWTGNVTLTKSRDDNTITVTSSGKAGISNVFDVSPAALHHFTFESISSPQIAGTPFEITIYAEDFYNNRVISFSSSANLSDATGTISPQTTTNFSGGAWTGSVTITKSQTDVTINVSQSGKNGQSNIFNVNPGTLNSFQISNISTQAAGEPFQITVTAFDAHLNIATYFTGTVDISDLTGTINPTISSNFVSGKWTGNVTITQVRQNNRITVKNTAGLQTGQSNLFNIISSSVDHFDISTISSTQVAGVQFSITITAKDADNNTVTGFTGTASLTDLTGTISPTSTGNFSNGAWTGNVTVTKSWSNNRITATSSGRAGQSNFFNVTHNSLDHFEFNNISSPQIVGFSFTITIKAKDIYSNIVTSYSSSVGLTDNTGTISPTITSSFSSGQWSGNVMITKKQNDVYIVANGSGKLGQSNFFNVKAANVAYLKIVDAGGGTGQEVGNLTMTLDDKIKLYCAGYDSYNNYVRDVNANWWATGNLDQPSPTKGKSTVFDPRTPGTTGRIHADSTGVQPDETGDIVVGSISYVKIRTAPGGAGVEISNITLTADENLALYCAGYDAGNNYVGDVSVQWSSIGTLMPVVNDTGTVINFLPTKAPASGRIIASHATAIDDSTGVITVIPGVPVGTIGLTPTPPVIPANGISTSIIKSDVIKDADANVIAKNIQFTVNTTLGTITSTDVNSLLPGIQVAANDSGKIQLTLKSSTAGGIAYISVSSVNGSANGNTSVTMSNLSILSVSSSKLSVSQGQTNVPVSMVVQNLGSSTITDLAAGLIFRGPAPLFENRNADFPNVVRTDGVTNIPGGSTRTLTFTTSVRATAKTDTVTIDSWIYGKINTVTVSDTFAVSKWKWAVQTPPQLRITKVYSVLSEVSQGRTAINVSMNVVNQGQANANVVLDTLSFWSINKAKDVTGEYQIIPEATNPTVIIGDGSIHQFDFSVSVSTAATLGQVMINGRINGTDENSGTPVSDITADTTHIWLVKNAPIVGIKGFYASQLIVTKDQTLPWQLKLIVENKGGTPVKLDSASAAFFLGGSDVTSEYTVITPIKFIISNNNILSGGSVDTLNYIVTKTGSSIGQVTIRARIYLTDLGSGNPITDETFTGVWVEEPAQLKIVNLIPSQNSVTRDQEQNWNVKVVLSNDGGSDIQINTSIANTFLNFSTGSDFNVRQPDSLTSGGLSLRAGTIDTLNFIIDRTGKTPGNCILSAQIMGIQPTIGDTSIATFQRTTPLIIEEPAKIKILSVISHAPNPPFVNKGQVFPIHVTLENNGQDEIKEATVRMTGAGGSIADSLTAKLANINGGGGRKEQIFSIKADSLTTTADIFKAEITKVEAQNTKESKGVIHETSPDSTESVIIQTPATFQIANIITPDTIRASQVEPWEIVLVVRNIGQASATITAPEANDIVIKLEQVDYKDYIILPPSALQSGGLILSGGRTDTLIYTVMTTGNNAGSANIEVALQANDMNNQQLLIAQKSYEFYISSSSAVQLLKTEPICNNYDGEKGLVNRGQLFPIRVTIQNLGRKRVRDVVVKLTKSGGSIISQDQLTLPSIDHNDTRYADFQITADPDQTNLNEVFTSEIISAIEYDTGLPAFVDNTRNNKARIAVHDSAKLELQAWTTDTTYTINQKFALKAQVKNLGNLPAEVDDSGLLRLFVPDGYRIIVGTDTIPASNGVSFKPNQTIEWSVLTPEFASGPDTLIVSIENTPKDKNINSRALVVQRNDTVLVRTLATNILYSTSIAEPEGATDGIVSTLQDFTVQSVIQYSRNLKNVQATLVLPEGNPQYKFQSTADSTQDVGSLSPVKWVLNAPESPDGDSRKILIKITAFEKGNPLLFIDSVKVKTVLRARLQLVSAITFPESASEGRLTVSRPFQIRAEMVNLGIADAIGTGEMRINLGSTGCTFADTSENEIKTTKVDSAVIWNLVAPAVPTPESSISVRLLNRPLDENTDDPAYVEEGDERAEILVRTVEMGGFQIATFIQSPEGAKDSVLSSHQELVVAVDANSFGVADPKAELILPGSFSFASDVKQKQTLEPGESSAQWRIKAPNDSVSSSELKIVCFGKDINDETVTIKSDTARLVVNVIRRAEAKVVANIISPAQAMDNRVSINQQFVLRAYLENYGQADFGEGAYNLELVLPQDYTTDDDLIRTTTGHNYVDWRIKSPSQATPAANMEVKVPPGAEPRDENSGEAVHFWQELRREVINIETVEKIVRVVPLENRTPNIVSINQTNISMLGLSILNTEEGQFSNNIILNGFEIMIKDREGNQVEQPGQVISRIAITNYNDPNHIFGQVTDFTSGSLVPIYFSQPDTISAGEAHSLDILVDITQAPSLDNVLLSINSDTNIFIQEEFTPKKPLLKGIRDESISELNLKSDFCMIRGNNLKDFFCNYPNPFGTPERPTTTITYYLEQDTDVEITIYTLIGELVWSQKYQANEPQGRKGPHDGDVIWDARNDKGYRVLNGVYIIYFKTGSGENAMTKAAVIK